MSSPYKRAQPDDQGSPTPKSQSGDSLSPYKKIKIRNTSYVQYTSIKDLAPHKLYQITTIVETNHPQFGQGFMAYLSDYRKKGYKVQLPTKYLATLTIPDDIDFFKNDISDRRNPYLIFREVLPNGSFRIDIIPKSQNTENHYKVGTDYPELDDLGSSREENNETETGGSGEDKAKTGLEPGK